MSYTHDRMIEAASFDAVDARVRAALAERGFGVLTEIDVKATLKGNHPARAVGDQGPSSRCISMSSRRLSMPNGEKARTASSPRP